MQFQKFYVFIFIARTININLNVNIFDVIKFIYIEK